jgi:hypothetical protein
MVDSKQELLDLGGGRQPESRAFNRVLCGLRRRRDRQLAESVALFASGQN